MPAPAAVEFLPMPDVGRVFTDTRTVRLGDVDRRGRLRLDATARLLQDIATDDANDAGLDRRFGWLVRRTCIATGVPGHLGECVDVATWCTGMGRSWAERRSSIIGERGARIDAVSLWVQIDVTTGRPARIADDFIDAYGATAAGRTVSARLSLDGTPSPSAVAELDWHVRRSDLDPFAHVNNAANWAFLEEVAGLDAVSETPTEAEPRVGTAEMEYLHPVVHDRELTVMTDRRRDDPGAGAGAAALAAWLVSGEVVLSASRWSAGRVDVSEG